MIHVTGLHLQQGAFALSDVGFAIPAGRYGVLMGESGSGKTTILEAVCGLRPILAGRITVAGRDVTALGPAHRNIGYVTQEDSLFASMTVAQNIGYALRLRHTPADRIARKTAQLAEVMRIGDLLPRRTDKLSGGEKQRVALARALAFDPPVLCLDEPLSALDEGVRGDMELLLKRVQRDTGATVLHITHSSGEAQRLADVVLRMQDGNVIPQHEAMEATASA